MNEQKLKELWWKARIGYNEQNCDPEVLAKFVELIVRECMEVTKTFTSNQGLDYSAPVALAKHFGVRE